jgi:pSer/pThr/pTyr-binding forkhead associated (FHA) protein
MAAQFQFVMRSGPNVGKVFPLESAEISIGRDNSNAVAINDPEVSRKHAKMELRGTAYVITDLGSTNGTFVNGTRLGGTTVLNPGDTVSFGEGIVLQYEAAYDPNATMVSSSAKAPKTVAPVRPARPAPAPAPAYSGQVPAGPAAEPAQPKKKNTGLVVAIVIGALVLICLCVVLFAWFAPQSLLCAPVIRIFSNIIGPIFGYGACQ